MTITVLWQRRKDLSWTKVTVTRSHTRLKPALRENGTTKWYHGDVEKILVRRWHGEAGKWRLLVQRKPNMTDDERRAWVSPDHLANSRRFT